MASATLLLLDCEQNLNTICLKSNIASRFISNFEFQATKHVETPFPPSRISALMTTRAPASRQPGSTQHSPGTWPHAREELLPFLVDILAAVTGALEDLVLHVGSRHTKLHH